MAEREFQLFTGARIQKFKIPEENLLYYAEHPAVEQDKTEEEIIRGGISNPIGGVSLDRIPRDAKVIIIVDDATRQMCIRDRRGYSALPEPGNSRGCSSSGQAKS